MLVFTLVSGVYAVAHVVHEPGVQWWLALLAGVLLGTYAFLAEEEK